MSRIRSQLDYLMNGQGGHSPQEAAPRRAFQDVHQPAFGNPVQNGYVQAAMPQASHMANPQSYAHQAPNHPANYAEPTVPQAHYPQHQAMVREPHPVPQHIQPAQQPAAPSVSREEIEKLHDGLTHLARKIQSLPKYLSRPEGQEQSEQMIGEIRNGFALVQKEVRRTGASVDQRLDGELHRIADGIAALQQSNSVHPDYVEQMQLELRNLQTGLNNLLEKPDPHFDLSGISRSIETGYSDIVDRLDGWLSTRDQEMPAPPIHVADLPEIPDYSGQFDALNRKIEEVTRAVVSMSVSTGASEDRDSFDRIEARLNSLAKSVDDLLSDGSTASNPVADAVEVQLTQLSQKLDNMVTMDAAGGQIIGDIDGVSRRLDVIQENVAALTHNIQLSSVSGDGGDQNAAFKMVESGLLELGNRIDAVAAGDAGDRDGSGKEILSTLRDLVSRVENLEQTPAQAPAMMDDSRLAALEDQLHGIAGQLQSVSAPSADLSPITERLENLEGQIASSRDIVIDMVNQTAQSGAGSSDPQSAVMLSAMMDEIKDLKANNAPSDYPDYGDRFGELMHSVSAISARLDAFENKLVSMPQTASPATPAIAHAGIHADLEPEVATQPSEADSMIDAGLYANASMGPSAADLTEEVSADSRMEYADAPSIDMSMGDGFGDEHQPAELEIEGEQTPSETELEDVPLAPGSGMPDLEALVRKAAHRKKPGKQDDSDDNENISELMAAARRAAQAASAEAETLKVSGDSKTGKSKLSGIKTAGLISKKSLMLAGAAAVVALGAYTFVPKVISGIFGGGSEEISMVEPVGEPREMAAAGEAAVDGEITAAAGSEEIAGDAAKEIPAAREIPLEGSSAVDTQADSQIAAPTDTMATVGEDVLADASQTNVEETIAPEATNIEKTEPVSASGMMPAEEAGNLALRNAAIGGDSNALFEIGRRYTDGDGVERNLEEAVKWYRTSAETGNAPAQYRLGNFYEKGHGVEQNPGEAAEWYRKSAEQGNALAMHNLAVLHAMGVIGGDPDMAEAIIWFQKAANLGVKDSQVNLGILYTKGMGVEENLEEAYKWFAIASRAGDADASKKRDTVAQALRPEQLEKARGMAELWKPGKLDREKNIATVLPEWKSGTNGNTVNVSGRELVRQVQTLLGKAGYDAGPADGLMGAKTRNAIISFQENSGMTADGKVSRQLLDALSKVSI